MAIPSKAVKMDVGHYGSGRSPKNPAKVPSVASTPEYVMDVVGVSKSFRRQVSTYSSFKSSLLGKFLAGKSAQPSNSPYIAALCDVTMRVRKGSSLGVIGRNGSGKSTLLKLITGIYRPDRGSVVLQGRVAALIELGAGFHPDFSGRENVELSAALLGLKKREIADRFDEIVEFAELQEVIDQPVRTYSSGMFMRLGFSVAVHSDPDILLIDEVLAVGDAGFVSKCRDKLYQLRGDGMTMLLVSHDLDSVERFSDEVVWLDKGIIKDRGEPRRVIDHYRQFIEQQEAKSLDEKFSDSKGDSPKVTEQMESTEGASRWGSREVEIDEVRVTDSNGKIAHLVHHGSDLMIRIAYHCNESIVDLDGRPDLVFGIAFRRADGLVVGGTNTLLENLVFETLPERGELVVVVERADLVDGNYALDVAVHKRDGYPFDYWKGAATIAVRSEKSRVGVWAPKMRWSLSKAEKQPAAISEERL